MGLLKDRNRASRGPRWGDLRTLIGPLRFAIGPQWGPLRALKRAHWGLLAGHLGVELGSFPSHPRAPRFSFFFTFYDTLTIHCSVLLASLGRSTPPFLAPRFPFLRFFLFFLFLLDTNHTFLCFHSPFLDLFLSGTLPGAPLDPSRAPHGPPPSPVITVTPVTV
jgi:hypothetical protein